MNYVKFKSLIKKPIIISKGRREKIRSKFFLNHLWCDSFEKFKEKHNRYALIEGEEKFNNGDKYFFIIKLMMSIFWFIINYFYYKGFIDGKLGLYFSFTYSKYIWDIENRLRDLSLKK